MGRISNVVQQEHLVRFPGERSLLTPFLSDFDITWADRREGLGTRASFFFLKPEKHASHRYGFEREVVLMYSPYPALEPRTLQLLDRFFMSSPAATRVETVCFVLVADDPRIRLRASDLMMSSVETRTIVPFTRLELEQGRSEGLVLDRMSEQLYARDLFDISQALVEDTYFFGRRQLVLDLRDRFNRGENTGLFGLRKMGKTSTVAKLRRTLKGADGNAAVIQLDAQDPAIYGLRWWEVLARLIAEAERETNVTVPKRFAQITEPGAAAEQFGKAMDHLRSAGAFSRALLVFDEFEHMCPELSLAPHWQDDFVPLWQTIRSYQNRTRAVSCLVVGVNPRFAEITTIQGRDNPLFALVPKLFVPAFDLAEVRDMVRTLGRYMGMRFDESCYQYLHQRYGGHPLLIRLACSWVHHLLVSQSMERPIEASVGHFKDFELERDASLEPYARHIMDVLTSWYPLEYEMFQMLCSGNVSDYEELAEGDPQLLEHLAGYGLVDGIRASEPANLMLADFVRKATKKRRSAAAPQSATVQSWSIELERLADTVVHSRIYTQELAMNLKVEPLFTDDRVKMPAKLADLRVTPVSITREQFQGAVSTMQQLTYDCIATTKRSYVRKEFPHLWRAVDRIRCLRHWQEHPDLSDPDVRTVVIEFLQSYSGGFPSEPAEWARMHIELMKELVAGLKDAQGRMFKLRPGKGAKA